VLLNGIITTTTPILDDVERREAERSEAPRSEAASKIDPASPAPTGSKPDPEFTTDAKRRTFTAEYKLRILEEADAATGEGLIGALLRREGLYSSLLSTWRRERQEGTLTGLRKRGPQSRPVDIRDEELRKLRRENERLAVELRKAHLVIEVQKKVALLWERQVGPEEKP
jgi:transposase